MPIKDYTLLAEQPLSARPLGDAERLAIVISAIVDDRGERHVLSRFGDRVWELWPFFEQANLPASNKRIDWARAPAQFCDSIKAALYRYWVVGAPGWARPNASTVILTFRGLLPFLHYLGSRRITTLLQVQALHVHNFLQEQLAVGMSPSYVHVLHRAIGVIYRFRGEHREGLTFDLWPDESEVLAHGSAHPPGKRHSAKTPVIPHESLRRLFTSAEKSIREADTLLDERDAGRRPGANSDADLIRIRTACFFLIGLLTGMRCDELTGIEVNAGRTEVKDGITYHWVKTTEHKTKKGRVEYLMPSMGLTLLRIMERWSQPLRTRLREQLAVWNTEESGDGKAERLRRIAAARASVNRVFLGTARGEITTVSGKGWDANLKRFADAADAEWPLASHQLRRTYAWTFVRHRLGSMLFLREQFKHSSLEMTQLYAANPQQDPALYDELLTELRDRKVEIIQHWLSDDVKLSGGAGRKIMELRANNFDNRKELIEDTAESVHIRSTGHAWCLAQDDGCGGAGLYERTRCANCSNGCIDDNHAAIWKEIYAHQLELVENAKELGPGAQQRVERDRKRALQVLIDLSLAPEDQN